MIRRTALIAAVFLFVVGGFAQEAKTDQHAKYKLDFVLKQMDRGKPLSTHNFTMSAEASGGSSQIRTGNRIPVDIGGDKGLQYMDVGFNCDARIIQSGSSNVGLEVGWEISTMPGTSGSEKMVRQVRSRSTPLVTFGKPTVVSSVDDINSGQQFELDVTVTPES
ncbi:hypothetical protein Acid345_0589 [Candidatus Koribacter versatilis Ellin345]|uniref:Uncharacterized protein n=1 Tax=Koribacter versatilis (strain Ellin345) TaxID=204669 RepID=Q1IU56_KORVE|nr:hypothetical protein [Candidatus Koribacter versatilis]ABF39594.1 hypothetical protein Acid345_0589 [Candidatus Koribacter versatilis Ellin345]